jgi:hemerythrin
MVEVKDEVRGIVFKRVVGVDYSMIRNDIKMFNIFLSVDGERTVDTIAQEDAYDPEYLFSAIDKLEKMGLLMPLDGAFRDEFEETQFDVTACTLPKQFVTGIEAVDHQHQRLVEMVAQLDDLRKTAFSTPARKQEAVGAIVSEMIDYTISHFAFEESLMQDANYEFYNAHKRVHELLVQRAGEYKERWLAGEDIADELYDVLSRWLFNHICNDDKAYAPSVKKIIAVREKTDKGWLGSLFERFFK